MINIESRFDEFYRKYYPVLLRYISSKQITQISADDVAHETLTLLWKKRDECRFEDEGLLLAWLMRSARYMAVAHLRKYRSNEDLSNYENTAGDIDHIEHHIEEAQLRQYINEIEQDLSDRDKYLFKAIFVERRSYAECAEELDIKEVSLRSRISRLRERLRPHINKIIEDNKKT